MDQKPRIIILFAGRFPSEKAASLFVDLNACSLVEAGAQVTVIAPRRLGRGALTDTLYEVIYLPTLDISRIPIIWAAANYISVAVFSLSALMWLIFYRSKEDVIISNDAVPLLCASLVTRKLLYEMHDFPDRSPGMYRMLFHRVKWILATNAWKAAEVQKRFSILARKVFIERNAVDVSKFGNIEKSEARRQLNLTSDAKLAVYTGHLYEWKGADTLAEAAAHLPDVKIVFVGGTMSDVDRFTDAHSGVSNIQIVGQVPHDQIPLWQAAADVLVLPNSAKEEISVHYTSPMKLFEYMASRRPIVASDLPSIREVLPAQVGYFACPDDPESLAETISTALSDKNSEARAAEARVIVSEYTWAKRTQRILQRIA